MHLRTELPGLCLRHWHPDDKPALLAHADNRKVWRNLTHLFPSPYTEADADHWIALSNQPSRGLNLAIDLDGLAIGGMGISAGEGVFERTAEFGYWLAEPWWGRGLTTAAGRAFLDQVQGLRSFARIEAGVFGWNPVSMRVLEKLGFVREATLRRSVFKDGQMTDRVLYACLLDD